MATENDFEVLDEEPLQFSVIEDGEEVEYTEVFTFENEETGKYYVVFTDNQPNEDGDIAVDAAVVDPEAFDAAVAAGQPVELFDVETDEEWDLIEGMLEDYNDLMDAYEAGEISDEDLEDEE